MAAAAVYSPSVYDSLPSLHAASNIFEQLQPQAILEKEIAYVQILYMWIIIVKLPALGGK